MDNWELADVIHDLKMNNRSFVVATVVNVSGSSIGKPGFKEIIGDDGSIIYGTLGGACPDTAIIMKAKEVLNKGEGMLLKVRLDSGNSGEVNDAGNGEIVVQTYCGGAMDIFLEPFRPPPRIVVIGQGGRDPVEDSLTGIAKMLGFQVVLIDPNPRLKHQPDALIDPNVEDMGKFQFGPDDFVVVMTKGEKDLDVLRLLAKVKVRYIGMLASRNRFSRDREILLKDGVPESFLNSIHSPIGINIGAKTPEEIAVSIVAEIIKERRGS